MIDSIVHEAKEFFEERQGAADETRNRRAMIDDLKFCFVDGEQWTAEARQKRKGKPCLSFNRSAGAVNQLIGDQRMTQPGGKVRAINKQGAVEISEDIAGLIRDIEAQSAAPRIYAEAFKYAAAGAWGAWRVVPEYPDEDSFDQVLRLKRVPNPLTIFFDGLADPFGRGAMQCLVTDRISKSAYKALYGGKPTNIEVSNDAEGWFSDKEVRIAEYNRMNCREREIALLSDGRVVQYDKDLERELAAMRASGLDAPTIKRKRKRKQWYMTWWKIDGGSVLEGPVEYEYRFIPIIRLPGRHVNIEGEQHFQSLIRPGKDSARAYNYNRSAMIEQVALTPRAPWVLTGAMVAGHEKMWSDSNVSTSPFLLYNIDEAHPDARPQRDRGPDIPQAYVALAMHDAEDIRQTIGYTNPAVEQQTRAGDAESGRALRTRLTAGDSGSYEFLDNFSQAVQYTWEILVNMIPVHYDTQRMVRILGQDGRESFKQLDPAAFKEAQFDVAVTLGPAYATARMEALDTLLQASQTIPMVGELAPDIVVANLDVKGASEIERRIRQKLIAAGVIQPTEEEAQAMGPPPPPDPTQVALKDSLDAKTARDKAEAVKTSVETAKVMAEADAAPRREQLELAQLVADLVQSKVETMLAQKELTAPRETTTGPGRA